REFKESSLLVSPKTSAAEWAAAVVAKTALATNTNGDESGTRQETLAYDGNVANQKQEQRQMGSGGDGSKDNVADRKSTASEAPPIPDDLGKGGLDRKSGIKSMEIAESQAAKSVKSVGKGSRRGKGKMSRTRMQWVACTWGLT
ncbi:hypothetical protein HDU76_011490, partial [Blyttiomyces sp. JEL0837]